MASRIEELLERAVVALDRSAVANEELIRLATEERDYGDSLTAPPVCPVCHKFNPKIIVLNHDRVGDMAEFVLVANCQECNQIFYAVPQGWVPFIHADEVSNYLSEKGGK